VPSECCKLPFLFYSTQAGYAGADFFQPLIIYTRVLRQEKIAEDKWPLKNIKIPVAFRKTVVLALADMSWPKLYMAFAKSGRVTTGSVIFFNPAVQLTHDL
jgi:hypothetical protein